MNKNESKYFNTAKKLRDSLLSLLNKNDFEFITIKRICEEAGVNRSTFYLHYENTYDLLQELIEVLNTSFIESFNHKKLVVSNEHLDNLFLINDEYLIPYLDFIYQNRRVYKVIRSKPEIFKANDSYQKMYDNIFSPILNKYNVQEEEKKYIINYFIQGLSAIIITWVIDDCLMPKEQIIKLIKECVGYQKWR